MSTVRITIELTVPEAVAAASALYSHWLSSSHYSAGQRKRTAAVKRALNKISSALHSEQIIWRSREKDLWGEL